MFASFFSWPLNQTWFWVVMAVLAGVVWLLNDLAKLAKNPHFQAGAKWGAGLFK
jgi:hypothetical protein